MEVNDAMVENLANLSRLTFTDLEKEEIKSDLQRMISFVEKLSEVDTSNTEPLLHMSPSINVFREDEVKNEMRKEDALANSPGGNPDYFTVPKVIRK